MTIVPSTPLHTQELRSTPTRPSAPSGDFLALIPRDFARDHLILSQGRIEGVEQLLVTDSTDPNAIFNVGVRLEVEVHATKGDAEAIAHAIDEAYSARDTAAAGKEPLTEGLKTQGDIDALLAAADRDLLSTQGKGPLIQLVDALLFEALGRQASDVHVQPLDDRTLVRYRLDGVLHTVRELPRHLTPAVVSRIKVMGRMDIAERRVPQDGRASVTIADRSVDLRISTLPTSYGERAVIRLLDNSQQRCDFEQIGMPPQIADAFVDRASRAQGIILVTGPTGSGKTTTLYSTLRRIGSGEVNIMTIEDPIEYDLASVGLAISQSQINPRKGVTFATGLRHLLRQDPDIVMVGEIRDIETARIAIQSSLTGHLVFSTLHTNDAPSAVTRLIDLGIEPYLVSASLSAILAQRLVRLKHQACHGGGCSDCYETGFHGRTGIFELMVIDESIRQLIAARAELGVVRDAALRSGMRRLQDEGERLIDEGLTTAAEVQRVVAGAG